MSAHEGDTVAFCVIVEEMNVLSRRIAYMKTGFIYGNIDRNLTSFTRFVVRRLLQNVAERYFLTESNIIYTVGFRLR